jgi:glyoxylase-like metal-dependent hydrolase (beta-lactamase superfamily II)
MEAGATGRDGGRMGAAGGWEEVGERVFRRRYERLDLNVGAVLGDGEALVVDTRCTIGEARELLDDLRALTTSPCRHVVNTHAHFDHSFGNAAMRPARIWGHEACAAALRADGERLRAEALTYLPGAAAELATLPIDPPDRLLTTAATVTVGGRAVELRHLGRGHTDHDVVVVVPDAAVVFAGDLVEESGPPQYGDAYPLEWPKAILRLLDLTATTTTTVVPGHGDVVGAGFVRAQLGELTEMARLCELLRDGALHADEAVRRAPFPEPVARQAFDR